MNDIKTLSLTKVLSLLPLPTILLDAKGSISAASNSYWQLAEGRDELKDTLVSLTKKKELSGRQHFRNALGTWQLHWQRHPSSIFTIVTIVTEQMTTPCVSCVPSEEGSVVASTSASRELPGPEQTIALLDRAIKACAAANASLALAHLRANLNDSESMLSKADYELWRTLSRKLRAICRVSDLVGTTDEGDFLIILLGANLHDAQTVTQRVLGQLQTWLRQSIPTNISLAAGFSTWEPSIGAIEPALLIARAKENLTVATA